MRVPDVAAVHIATDDARIAAVAEAFGARVLMTSPSCRNGTERCAEALDHLRETPDVMINLQGDAPLTPASFITAIADAVTDPEIEMVATPAIRCSAAHYERLRADEAAGRVGGTTVVCDSHGRALYFSKRLIPHFSHASGAAQPPIRLHIGAYAYTPAALRAYQATPPSELELLEGLEQLRFLDRGTPVRVVEVKPPPWEMWELNNPGDVAPIEAALRKEGLP